MFSVYGVSIGITQLFDIKRIIIIGADCRGMTDGDDKQDEPDASLACLETRNASRS